MNTKIKSKKITETKNFIKGHFLLTDKSKTYFEINKKMAIGFSGAIALKIYACQCLVLKILQNN